MIITTIIIIIIIIRVFDISATFKCTIHLIDYVYVDINVYCLPSDVIVVTTRINTLLIKRETRGMNRMTLKQNQQMPLVKLNSKSLDGRLAE